MALGARPAQMLRAVLVQGVRLGLGGGALGLIGAVTGALVLRGLLFGVAPLEWTALCAVLALVIAISALAGFFPALRAARVDPNAALREP
jgi:putative ABC transport system permease protein